MHFESDFPGIHRNYRRSGAVSWTHACWLYISWANWERGETYGSVELLDDCQEELDVLVGTDGDFWTHGCWYRGWYELDVDGCGYVATGRRCCCGGQIKVGEVVGQEWYESTQERKRSSVCQHTD